MDAFMGFSVGTLILLVLAGVGMVGCPQYEVYRQRLKGEAELARAGQNRQIMVTQMERIVRT